MALKNRMTLAIVLHIAADSDDAVEDRAHSVVLSLAQVARRDRNRPDRPVVPGVDADAAQ